MYFCQSAIFLLPLRQQVLFTRRANLKGMQSLLVLPLIVREDVIGTLAFAAVRQAAFGNSVRPALQVLANQLAVSYSNAASVRRLEELATTDGLTGCLNKRTFLYELERKIRDVARSRAASAPSTHPTPTTAETSMS